MQTIVEPKGHIAKLWGKQRNTDGETFRMMQYVIRIDDEDKVLLHNVVTGQLIVLDQNEAMLVNRLPMKYSNEMDQLIDGHYLVPEQYDEHQSVIQLRNVLKKLEAVQKRPGITHYTILPTTACNARCYYCFEHGFRISTMSEQTADSVVNFIVSHCNESRTVFLSWFGGEPTVAAHRIDQICKGLQKNGITYKSDITTNGYLLDEALTAKAKELWNLTLVKISMDGAEDTYNRVKAYVGANDSPYQRVMTNIGHLLSQGIRVSLRMNFDLGNYHEFSDLIQDMKDRFPDKTHLQLQSHPVIGEYKDSKGMVLHGDDTWFEREIVELNRKARESGMLAPKRTLPSLKYHVCQAASDSSVTITPEGYLVRCPEQYGDDQITGNIWQGITNEELVKSWKIISDYPKCRECVLFPECLRISRCSAQSRCYYLKEHLTQYKASMKHEMCSYNKMSRRKHNDV